MHDFFGHKNPLVFFLVVVVDVLQEIVSLTMNHVVCVIRAVDGREGDVSLDRLDGFDPLMC